MAEPSFRMTASSSRVMDATANSSSPFTPTLSSPSSKVSSKHSPSSVSPLQQNPTPVLPKSPLHNTNPPVSPPPPSRTPCPTPAEAVVYPSSRPPQKPKTTRRNPHRSSSCSCCRVVCVLLLLLLLLLLLAFIFGAVCYLWFQPKLPVLELSAIQFPRFNVSSEPDATYFDSRTIVDFKFKNRNEKISFNYDRVRVRLSVGDDIDLGSTDIPGFTQPIKNTTLIKFETGVDHLEIGDSDGFTLMKRLQAKSIAVSVDIRTRFGITLDCRDWKLGMVPIRVLCENVQWKSSQAGATNNPQCTINIFKLIRLDL